MSHRSADSLLPGSRWNSVLIPLASCQQNLYDINLLLCVQWKTPDDGQRNCPKHVEFYSKNKFEKLVHLVGFIITRSNNRHRLEQQCHIQTTQAWSSVQAKTSHKKGETKRHVRGEMLQFSKESEQKHFIPIHSDNKKKKKNVGRAERQ